ncbi:hypothetical protein ACFQ3L_04035 [Lacticaseibacillus jixianensis]|uniref:Small secreted protein n=1 Tax=Lacticaseibacillus jixianensis TaxID=2486012 RepID=A0ABW4B8S0_9LACO|nr:hypothetical protein [Lacticaseibacillus jixianensis]
MKKSTWLTLGSLSLAALTAAYAIQNHDYWHRRLPNRLFKTIKTQLAAPSTITGGWIDMNPDGSLVDGKLMASYRGGVTTTSGTFHFTVAETGKLVTLDRI